MRTAEGVRKKIHFFAMVLSRSRMKFVYFQDKPFTVETICEAHEKAFDYFNGIPHTLVYDQDRVLIVSENIGDVVLTSFFKKYVKSRGIKLHFCRKSDPQSKGKIENVIQYVKKNFLYNRSYHDPESLNEETIKCLFQLKSIPLFHSKSIPFLVNKKGYVVLCWGYPQQRTTYPRLVRVF